MTLWVKTPATMPDDLSSITETHVDKGERTEASSFLSSSNKSLDTPISYTSNR